MFHLPCLIYLGNTKMCLHFLLKKMLLFFIIATFLHHNQIPSLVMADDQAVYQPVPSEIDRFKMIQEKIIQEHQQQQNHHQPQEEEQQNVIEEQGDHLIHHRPNEADEGGHLARHHQHYFNPQLTYNPNQHHLHQHPHPFLSHLFQKLTGASPGHHQQQQQQHPFVISQATHPQQMMHENPIQNGPPPAQHHYEQMSPSSQLNAPSHHLPVLPQFPQISPTIQQQLAQQQQQLHQSILNGGGGNADQHQPSGSSSNSLATAPHLNPQTYQTLMEKNLVLPGELAPSIDKQETAPTAHDETGVELKNDDKDREDRHHKDRGSHGHGHSSLMSPRRCYSCSWSIAQCHDFNCYNNPDICTNNRFRGHKVQQADCPSGCEQFVVTDPNGLIQTWKRGCAPPSLPIKGYRCKTHYEFGIRIDRCVCNQDWCNLGTSLHRGQPLWAIIFLPCFSLLIHWLFLNRLLN